MKKILVGLFAVVILGAGVVTSGMLTRPVMAAGDLNLCDDDQISDELKEAAGCREGDDQNKTIFPAVKFFIDVVLSVIGIIGVGVIIYGGVTYTLSTGDAVKVNRAKNIILYGVIGMIVAGLAYVIVEFVSKSISG